jgi:hypothetical protein
MSLGTYAPAFGAYIPEQVSANVRGFGMGLVYWFALALPSTYTTSMVIRVAFAYRGGGLGLIHSSKRFAICNRSWQLRSALV